MGRCGQIGTSTSSASVGGPSASTRLMRDTRRACAFLQTVRAATAEAREPPPRGHLEYLCRSHGRVVAA